MNILLTILLPLAQLYLLWRIYRAMNVMAAAEGRKQELITSARSLAMIIRDAADMPAPRKKKVVQFEAEDDTPSE